MSPYLKLVLIVIGTLIGGAASYWTVQAQANVPLDARFYIGWTMASLSPVGALLVGLAMKAPWDQGGNGQPPAK